MSIAAIVDWDVLGEECQLLGMSVLYSYVDGTFLVSSIKMEIIPS